MRRIAGILHGKLRHRIGVVIKKHQRREGLIDRHAQDFAKAGKAGGGNAFKKVGVVQPIGVACAAQYAVVHQDRRRFAVTPGKRLPVAQRRLFEIGFAHQIEPVAEFQIAKKLHAAARHFRHGANKERLAHLNGEGQPFQPFGKLLFVALKMLRQRLGKRLLLPLLIEHRGQSTRNGIGFRD